MTEELHLHHMYLRNGYTGDFGPSLVGVSIVIQELVAKHQRHSEQSILASRLPFDIRILILEPPDEHESQQSDILCDLRC